jgi:hypothetical protein
MEAHWEAICRAIDRSTPCYALQEWRKVFRVNLPEGLVLYVKVVDERFHERNNFLGRMFSTESHRYFSTYRLFREIGIPTPDLLFLIEEKSGLSWTTSIMGTRELDNHTSLSEYFINGGRQERSVKEPIMHEIARLAAKLHSLGLYFSMDGRNIFVRKPYLENTDNLSLIDLDHVKASPFGKIPKRRRLRNLSRFASTLGSSPGLAESDFAIFIDYYNQYFRAN